MKPPGNLQKLVDFFADQTRKDVVKGKKIAAAMMLDSLFSVLRPWNATNLSNFFTQFRQFYSVIRVPMIHEAGERPWSSLQYEEKQVSGLGALQPLPSVPSGQPESPTSQWPADPSPQCTGTVTSLQTGGPSTPFLQIPPLRNSLFPPIFFLLSTLAPFLIRPRPHSCSHPHQAPPAPLTPPLAWPRPHSWSHSSPGLQAEEKGVDPPSLHQHLDLSEARAVWTHLWARSDMAVEPSEASGAPT